MTIEQVDRLVRAQDEQDRAGDVEVVLRAGLASLRAVMSIRRPSQVTGRLESSRTTVSRSHTQTTRPSLRISRYSRSELPS